jgi:Ca-activated chloride channel family protein
MNSSLETRLGDTQLPNSGGQTTAEVEIGVNNPSTGNLPIDIVFCIDCSGTMGGDPIRVAEQGVRKAVGNLSRDDTVGVVRFSSSAEVILDPISGDQTQKANDALQQLSAGGKTNMAEGLGESKRLLSEMAQNRPETDAVQLIVLVTDGKPNLHNVSEFDIPAYEYESEDVDLYTDIGSGLNQTGITVHSAGVGGYKQEFIKEVSINSGGEYDHLESPQEMAEFFTIQVKDAQDIVATNPILEFTERNGTTIENIGQEIPQIGEPDIEQHGDRYIVHAADVNRNKPPVYGLKLDIPKQDSGKQTIVDVELTIEQDYLTDSLEVKMVPDVAVDPDSGIKEVGERVDTMVQVIDDDSMDEGEEVERTKQYVREGN